MRDNDKSNLELGWPKKTLKFWPRRCTFSFASAVTDAVFFSLGVAVAVLDRKLYAAGGFDGRHRLRR